MGDQLQTRSTNELDANLARPVRLLLARSRAFALVENSNPGEEDEIRKAISPDLQRDLEPAIEGVRRELMPVSSLPEKAVEDFMAEIAGFVALAGGGWEPAQRQEFVEQALQEFADLPVSLVVPVVRAARRKLSWAREFVPWVFTHIENDLGKLQKEHRNLTRLKELAEGECK